jgi:hypothetical protein
MSNVFIPLAVGALEKYGIGRTRDTEESEGYLESTAVNSAASLRFS